MSESFRRRSVQWVLGSLLVVVMVGAAASPAIAHAQLITTSPSNDSVVNGSPDTVTVSFDEAVSVAENGIQMFDGNGSRVDAGAARHGSSSSIVELPLRSDLADGPYVVTWRVISSDAHPLNGAFTFAVGTGEQARDQVVRDLLSAGEPDAVTGALSSVARAFVFAAMLFAIGAIGFVSAVRRRVAESSWFRRALCITAVAGAVSTVVGAVLQQAYVDALEPGDLFDTALLADSFGSNYGRFAVVRAVAFVVIAIFATRLAASRPARAIAAIAGVVTAASITASGHGVSGRWTALAIPLDVAHMVAAGLWLGGLVVLLVVIRRTEPGDALQRFSRLALFSVVVLVVTGTVQSIRQVESLAALTGTSYGQLLIVKVSLVALIVLIASGSRRWVNQRKATGDSPPVSQLIRSVRSEVIGGVAVVVVTALLVGASPTASATDGPETLSLDAGRVTFQVTVDPARQGPTVVHVYALSPRGLAVDVASMEATLSLPSKQIEDLPIDLQRLSTGHYSSNANLPLGGDWTLEVSAAIDDFTQLNASGKLKVG